MNYIYGQINQQAIKNVYSGSATSSAVVTVDNTNMKISVDTTIDPTEIEALIDAKINLLNFAKQKAEEGYIVDTVEERAGIINVTFRQLAEGDIPQISEDKIINLVDDLAKKQEQLISGENIKTINNQSILGSGNIEIHSGSELPLSVVDGELCITFKREE